MTALPRSIPVTNTATASLHRRRARRSGARVTLTLAGLVFACFALTLCLGQSVVPPGDVLRVLAGQDVPGASFLVGDLRLPRATMGVLGGLCFGLGGAAFQTMLRNPLASPDIVGITAGGSAAAVIAIVLLGWRGAEVSVLALAAGLGVAATIYLLSWRDGVSGTRLILIGIGISAMLDSVTGWVLLQAPSWSLQEALRWLTGSLNAARLAQAPLLAGALAVFGGLLLLRDRDLQIMRLGDDKAAALGVPLAGTRLIVTLAATGLITFATAATGPIAFVAFLSGPIAARAVGQGRSVLVPAAVTGALLVLAADFAGQFLLPSRYPVGVVTGVLGAPYLIFLVIRTNKNGYRT